MSSCTDINGLEISRVTISSVHKVPMVVGISIVSELVTVVWALVAVEDFKGVFIERIYWPLFEVRVGWAPLLRSSLPGSIDMMECLTLDLTDPECWD